MNSTSSLDVSIIVPCKNERNYISGFLDHMSAQELDGFRWEILIADGMSTDGTREILLECQCADERVKLIDNPQGIASTGLNLAILRSNGRYILRFDVHTEYASDYVRQCIAESERTGADNVGGPARTRASGLMPRAIAATYHSRFACGGALFHDVTHEGFVDTVPYGCWRRDLFDRIGLFDESLVRNQDDEFNLRTTRAGGRIWQSPKIVSWYHPRQMLSKLFHQYFQYGFWKIPVMRKHRGVASWRHLVPAAFASFLVALPLCVLGLFGLAKHLEAGGLLALWLAGLGLYSVCCLAATLMTARRYGWDLAVLLPIIFVTFHLSYGFGSLVGFLFWMAKPSQVSSTADAFSELTR